MKQQSEVLYSDYIIDGVPMESTPARILGECMSQEDISAPEGPEDKIADESIDPAPGKVVFEDSRVPEYLEQMSAKVPDCRDFELAFPESFTKTRIALGLIESIWLDGHFQLPDLTVDLRWDWDSDRLGAMAAFYDSCSAASDYIYDLGISIEKYRYAAKEGCNSFGCRVNVGGERKCPDKAGSEKSDWLIYIPFDNCRQRLGGSLLNALLGSNGDIAPDFGDPDYFMDCYEVVRELVEDGIITAGITVGDGGLALAASRFCTRCGCRLNISGIASSFSEKSSARILFSEIPGVLVQISDMDYDYFDSQLLLQDIAYYTLGHPDPECTGISVRNTGRPAISGILESLMAQASQISEGED